MSTESSFSPEMRAGKRGTIDFLGTVGFHDVAGLDLERGDNEILIAVSETFGGWAWAGAIEERAGLTLPSTD